jgi:hypothetical protein
VCLKNSLVLNPGQTQSILIGRRVSATEGVDPIVLNNEMVQFSDVVKNLGLLIDRRLSRRNQVSHVVSCPYATLRLLQRFQRFSSHLPCSYLDFTVFLYADVVFFPSLSSGEFRCLSLAFNA